MRKILVLRGGALGDFIVTLPALALLRQRWPASRIELVGNATAAHLALLPSLPATAGKCHPLDDTLISPHRKAREMCHPIDDTLIFPPKEVRGICHPLDDKSTLSSGMGRRVLDAVYSQHEGRWAALYGRASLPPVLEAWLAEFNLVLNYWPDPAGELSSRFPLHAGQVFLSAAALPSCDPAAKHYCEPLRQLGLEPVSYFHQLPIDSMTPGTSRSVAIHAGSGSAAKNWPMERWAQVCGWLQAERGAELLIVRGEAETATAAALEHFGEQARSLSLPDLAARLAQCQLFLGHDSGISHLAAACGVPCVLLFGPTEPATWAPPSPQVQVVRRGMTLDSIAVADVQVAILAASPDRR